jgi:hypothetical protein
MASLAVRKHFGDTACKTADSTTTTLTISLLLLQDGNKIMQCQAWCIAPLLLQIP